jgi:uncharacterized integral membrane protein
MADPQHVEQLDGQDVLTVTIYRLGLLAAALGLLAAAAALLARGFGQPVPAVSVHASFVIVVAGTAAAIANMHLYAKSVRWVIGAAGWLGAVLMIGSAPMPELAARWVWHAGLGFVFVAISAFALKERFCFRIPGLRLVPALLALSLVPLLSGSDLAAGALLGVAGAIQLALAIAKFRMPSHFDIGDKSRYQV